MKSYIAELLQLSALWGEQRPSWKQLPKKQAKLCAFFFPLLCWVGNCWSCPLPLGDQQPQGNRDSKTSKKAETIHNFSGNEWCSMYLSDISSVYLSICPIYLSKSKWFSTNTNRLHNPTYYETTCCSRWPTLQHHHLLVQGWEETDPENQLNAKHQYNLE